MFLKNRFIIFKSINYKILNKKGYLFKKIDQIIGYFQNKQEIIIDFIKIEAAILCETEMFFLLIWLS